MVSKKFMQTYANWVCVCVCLSYEHIFRLFVYIQI